MLLDFGELKTVLAEILSTLDHRDLNGHPAFTEASPSSELIARHIFHEARRLLAGHGVRVTAVTVGESDRAAATYKDEA